MVRRPWASARRWPREAAFGSDGRKVVEQTEQAEPQHGHEHDRRGAGIPRVVISGPVEDDEDGVGGDRCDAHQHADADGHDRGAVVHPGEQGCREMPRAAIQPKNEAAAPRPTAASSLIPARCPVERDR